VELRGLLGLGELPGEHRARAGIPGLDDLEPILDLFTPHGRTTTSIVHSSPVPPRALPLS
jgi:hypothetical protein